MAHGEPTTSGIQVNRTTEGSRSRWKTRIIIIVIVCTNYLAGNRCAVTIPGNCCDGEGRNRSCATKRLGSVPLCITYSYTVVRRPHHSERLRRQPQTSSPPVVDYDPHPMTLLSYYIFYHYLQLTVVAINFYLHLSLLRPACGFRHTILRLRRTLPESEWRAPRGLRRGLDNAQES
ncbi:unnamed protein product [Aphis gossypii]|uniref:Uncharacterized protein n=1 Tax=Aphis gossypii TaxID=80765 RepID=A0A9P0IS94_APHGO|nr:unnamed protein product [Aphis gossypii]